MFVIQHQQHTYNICNTAPAVYNICNTAPAVYNICNTALAVYNIYIYNTALTCILYVKYVRVIMHVCLQICDHHASPFTNLQCFNAAIKICISSQTHSRQSNSHQLFVRLYLGWIVALGACKGVERQDNQRKKYAGMMLSEMTTRAVCELGIE